MGKRGVLRGHSGQVSLEFAIIMGFVTLLIIPLISVFYYQVKETNDRMIVEQSYKVAKEIVDEAESVYYMGAPSKSMIKAYIPNHVQSIEISGRSVLFRIEISNATSDVEAISRVNLSGSINSAEGLRYIHLQATGDRVEIIG
ncbi:hypothetical protein COT07_00715 [Candidatus Woesearchaeota archaeon CG07_land_8_20_14_0_80_44_23]|nr:MAG: hypothetical protein COT07_00715 [Candidatus Woesearchaeota archaeon CG07_land_8_20_14_0_80_44_23]